MSCKNFPQLARACRKNPQGAADLLSAGVLEPFLGSLGRVDLALAARDAARHPDREPGLDDFLAKLPGTRARTLRVGGAPPGLDGRSERAYNDIGGAIFFLSLSEMASSGT
jgi:hypothetical protein